MKAIASIFTALIVVTLICLLLFYFKFNYVLGRILSSQLDAKVRISSVSFKKEAIDISRLRIKNPYGYTLPYAGTVGKIELGASYYNYLQQVIHIDHIDVLDAEITIEFSEKKGDTSNWSYLIDSLSTDPTHPHFGQKNLKDEDNRRYAVINRLTIHTLKVNVVRPGKQTETKVYTNMEFKNVVTKPGEITRSIANAIISRMVADYQNLITIPVQGIFAIFKGLFSYNQDESIKQAQR